MQDKELVDLHSHTNYSDGSDTPEEVVEKMAASGVGMAAVTDHDTVRGVERAIKHGQKVGVIIVPGVEVSTIYQSLYDVHVLGINVNYRLGWVEKLFSGNNLARRIFNQQAMQKLNKSGKLNPTIEELAKYYQYPGYCVTLLHAMDYMVKVQGLSFEEARNLAMCTDSLGVFRDLSLMLTMHKGVQGILRLGGVPIFAHPGEFEKQIDGNPEEKRGMLVGALRQFVKMGGRGIEAFHPKHSQQQQKDYVFLAQRMGLSVTAGRDYHGQHKLSQDVGCSEIKIIDVMNLITRR